MTLKQTLQDAFELAALRDEARAISRVGPHAATRLWAEVRETIDKAARSCERKISGVAMTTATPALKTTKSTCATRIISCRTGRMSRIHSEALSSIESQVSARQSRLLMEHGHQASTARINRGEDKRHAKHSQEARALYLAHGKLVAAFEREQPIPTTGHSAPCIGACEAKSDHDNSVQRNWRRNSQHGRFRKLWMRTGARCGARSPRGRSSDGMIEPLAEI